MVSRKNLTSKKRPAYTREVETKETRTGKRESLIVFSFKDFDRNQGQDFKDWDESKILLLLIEKLREICQLTITQALSQKIIKQYTKVTFPPNSKFKYPRHVLPDVTWCSLHIQGKECVIGYFEDNVFNIVFLDKDHEFWITKK